MEDLGLQIFHDNTKSEQSRRCADSFERDGSRRLKVLAISDGQSVHGLEA